MLRNGRKAYLIREPGVGTESAQYGASNRAPPDGNWIDAVNVSNAPRFQIGIAGVVAAFESRRPVQWVVVRAWVLEILGRVCMAASFLFHDRYLGSTKQMREACIDMPNAVFFQGQSGFG